MTCVHDAWLGFAEAGCRAIGILPFIALHVDQLRVDIGAGALMEDGLGIWETPLPGVFRGRVERMFGESILGG